VERLESRLLVSCKTRIRYINRASGVRYVKGQDGCLKRRVYDMLPYVSLGSAISTERRLDIMNIHTNLEVESSSITRRMNGGSLSPDCLPQNLVVLPISQAGSTYLGT
jgi:hypothetical protein